MSIEAQNNSEQTPEQEKQQSDKEINFARIRKQLEEEKQARLIAEQRAAEIQKIYEERMSSRQVPEGEHEDETDEPYVDHKRLEKRMAKFERTLDTKIDQRATEKAQKLMEEYQKNEWLKNNPDFFKVMDHAQDFADREPEMADAILKMPDNFERQKLVYRNIKALKLHQKEEEKASIQEKVNQNMRSPYYQPSGIGTAPYGMQGDYTPVGQKNAYQKMQELKSKLRI